MLGTAQTNAQACHKRIVERFKDVTNESLSTAQTNTEHGTNECLRMSQTRAQTRCAYVSMSQSENIPIVLQYFPIDLLQPRYRMTLLLQHLCSAAALTS